jgi:hypothetical protein
MMGARVTNAPESEVVTASVTACPGCGGTRRTCDGYRFKRVREWHTGRDGYPYRLRWAGYCSRCAAEAERARLRDVRLATRASTVCATCGVTFTHHGPARCIAPHAVVNVPTVVATNRGIPPAITRAGRK